MTAYKGDYDTFERTREEQLKNQQKAFEANEKARAHMQVCLEPDAENLKLFIAKFPNYFLRVAVLWLVVVEQFSYLCKHLLFCSLLLFIMLFPGESRR